LDGLVPVPTIWRSRREYSFSPPGAIARQVGDELRLPVLPIIVERGKKRRQVELDLSDRTKNVRGVYRLRRGARPAGGIFCIIDDVSTSGSTLQEIAKLLKNSGATRVYAAVLAKTNPEHTATHDA
jgi:predicted amidophosphoribosyltransferase